MTHEEAQNSPQTADRGSRALPDAADAGEAHGTTCTVEGCYGQRPDCAYATPTARSNGDTAPEACAAEHPSNPSAVPCVRDKGHEGSHMSTTGCGGSVMHWPADTAPEADQ